MKNFFKFLFSLFLLSVLLYTINDRYNLAAWLLESGDSNQAENEQAFAGQVRTAMLEGKEQATLQYIGKSENMEWFTEEVIDMVYNIDDITTSSDYDYLRYKANSIFTHVVGFGNVMTVTYEFEYNETAAETEQVDRTIKQLFDEWEINKLADYDKIKKSTILL